MKEGNRRGVLQMGRGGGEQRGCSGGLNPELKAERLILLAPTAGDSVQGMPGPPQWRGAQGR